MKRQKPFALILFHLAAAICLFHSCSERPSPPEAEIIEDHITPPKVTVLADLPDSLRPKVIYLDQQPKPITNVFSIPQPSKSFVDSLTGLPLAPYMHGTGFFTHYTSEDGLVDDYVQTIFIDKIGTLWIGTVGAGVSRYDGESFTTFNTDHGLVSNTIWGISEDSKGNIWFTTVTGISCYDGRKFTSYTTDQGLPFDDVGQMQEDNEGKLWFRTVGGGVTCFDGQTFTNYGEAQGLKNKFVFSIEKDTKGKLWFGTREGGVYTCQNTSDDTIRFEKFDGLPEWEEDVIRAIYSDRKGNIWFGTQQNGLACYDGQRIKKYTPQDGLPCESIYDILEDREGTIWLATCRGLSMLSDSVFMTFSTLNGLVKNSVRKLAEDDLGNIWFGTNGGGVSRYNGKAITKITDDPINVNVNDIIADRNGNLWFSTNSNGVSRYDGNEIISFTKDQGLARNTISFLAEDKLGRIWFSTYYGGGVGCLDFNLTQDSLLSLEPQPFSNNDSKPSHQARLTTYTTQQGLAFDAAYSITEDKTGNLWFATYGGGISRFDGQSFTNYTTKQGLASNDVFTIFEDSKGNLWILYVLSEGITLFDGKSFSTFTQAQGLPSLGVWNMAEDKEGNLWFGSEHGLILLRANELIEISKAKSSQEYSPELRFETFSTKDGLPDNTINNIHADHHGNLLVSTNSGLTILQGGLAAFNTKGAIENYNHHEGYAFRSVQFAFQDHEGIIWLSTNSDKTGLVRFDPKKRHSNTSAPLVFIKEININSEKVNWYGLSSSTSHLVSPDSNVAPAFICEEVTTFSRTLSDTERDSLRIKFKDIRFDSITKWHPVPVNLVLPYRHNSVTIDFNANITSQNHLVKYQYFLEGYDTDWSPVLSSSSATFGNIHEGQYTFKVKACSPDGVWSEPISYAFRVLPPKHRTWWAYSLYGLLFLTLAYYAQRYQKKRIIRAEQEKSKQKQAILNERLRISRDLHDEVGATLSGISMYSHIAKEQIKTQSNEGLLTSLNVMQDSSGDMVKKLNDIIWLLNPEQARLQQLVEKLEEYIRQLAEYKNVSVSVDIIDHISAIELPLEVRRNIYLIFKEAINNSFKYSQAKSISLTIKSVESDLVFILEDDGIGFDSETVKRGNGLNNMQSRSKEIGAKLQLDASPDRGTRMSLTYRLDKG
jgi:signal transduction histidine kinase/ligand-binding sensor domain-containing protein